METLHHNAKVEELIATDKYLISGGTDSNIQVMFMFESYRLILNDIRYGLGTIHEVETIYHVVFYENKDN
jgi:hypothetical protein